MLVGRVALVVTGSMTVRLLFCNLYDKETGPKGISYEKLGIVILHFSCLSTSVKYL